MTKLDWLKSLLEVSEQRLGPTALTTQQIRKQLAEAEKPKPPPQREQQFVAGWLKQLGR
jgi:hypothetical protein